MEEKLEFSTLQTKAIEAAEKGRNIFLTGGAGVGKSAVVKEIIRRMEAKGKRVVVLAPTGKAAINVGGETIHRFFGCKHLLRSQTYMRVLRIWTIPSEQNFKMSIWLSLMKSVWSDVMFLM